MYLESQAVRISVFEAVLSPKSYTGKARKVNSQSLFKFTSRISIGIPLSFKLFSALATALLLKMQCAHCKGAATLACSSCKSSPALDGDAGIAHYCNALCQKSDWVNHKRTCRRLQDRTSLFRVAMTSQQLYYMFRELTWAQFELSGVEKSGENLILRGEVRKG